MATTPELVALYRLLGDDEVKSDGALDDSEVEELLLEGEKEAAIRGRLIFDETQITVSGGAVIYALDDLFYELSHVAFVDSDGARHPVKLVSAESLDGATSEANPIIVPPTGSGYDMPSGSENWRDATGTPPLYAIQSDLSLRLVPIPTASGTLKIEGYRTPDRGADEDPEISQIHHSHLVQWALFRRFSIPDEDHFDGKRAATAYAEFERYFGKRPDSDLRRMTRHDTPHRVEAFFV